MKELSIEQKAKAYDEAIEKLREFYRDYDTVSCLIDVKEELANRFPELKESEDEKMLRVLREGFNILDKDDEWYSGITNGQILAWLKQQGEQKECATRDKIAEYLKKLILDQSQRGAHMLDNEGRIEEEVNFIINIAKKELKNEKQGEQKPCMIQWKGDNLKEIIGFTGKDKNFEKWFKSFEEYEKYVHEHNNIFKLFNEDGSHYEIPAGAWIVKTPDGYNVASKAVFKQKSAEWSEEDERKFADILALLIGEGNGYYDTLDLFTWFKSLKDRYVWKPSEEQMEALDDFIYAKYPNIEKHGASVKSLYQDLKKLKG